MSDNFPPNAAIAEDPRPILFVGDIQGCARELEGLLDRAAFQPGRHRLVPLGDTVSRGPDAPRVLELLAACAAEPILGNHERGLLEIGRTGEVPDWARADHCAYSQLVRAERWQVALTEFAGWPLWRRGAGWIAVHAGLHPALPVERTDAVFLTEVRWCDAAGRRPAQAPKGDLTPPAGFAPWYAHYRGDDAVVFGHWAQRGLVVEGRVRGLDTGCVYGGRLSGLWWPADRLVQVNARTAYRRVRGPVTRRLA